jgi:hypothetical protein
VSAAMFVVRCVGPRQDRLRRNFKGGSCGAAEEARISAPCSLPPCTAIMTVIKPCLRITMLWFCHEIRDCIVRRGSLRPMPHDICTLVCSCLVPCPVWSALPPSPAEMSSGCPPWSPAAGVSVGSWTELDAAKGIRSRQSRGRWRRTAPEQTESAGRAVSLRSLRCHHKVPVPRCPLVASRNRSLGCSFRLLISSLVCHQLARPPAMTPRPTDAAFWFKHVHDGPPTSCEIHNYGAKGLGLRATVGIKAGTVLFSENPQVVVPHHHLAGYGIPR